MAEILPGAPTGNLTTEQLRIYEVLRRLPDGVFYVWQRLNIQDAPGPDFWVLDNGRRALLFKVCGVTPHHVRAVAQPGLFGAAISADQIGFPEEAAVGHFHARLPEDLGDGALPAALLFPNLSAADLAQLAATGRRRKYPWLGKETLSRDAFQAWVEAHIGPALSPAQITALRRAFTPEVIIPPAFTVRDAPAARRTGAELGTYLLDYRQEQLLKTDLDLSAASKAAARDFSIRLVNGVAGSGKSLIIVFRAHLLRQHFPRSRILVLTHNRALIRDLRTRYARLSGGDNGVDWYTFQGWCRKTLPRPTGRHDIVDPRQREEIINDVWRVHLADTALTPALLEEEIDWFKDRLLFGLDDYLSADRSGRGFALAESMRRRTYAAMEAYHRELRSRELLDWGDVPRRIWAYMEGGRLQPPRYDVILIDEAQFFAPLWFEIIKKILAPNKGYLFMVADPSQGFLKRRQSWAASGLEVRGRAHRLDKSYRTTREILDFSLLLYRSRLPEEADDEKDDIVPPNLSDMPAGAPPVLIPLTSPQDEVTRVINEIRVLRERGTPWGHILIIHADGRQKNQMLARLRREFGPGAAADPGQVDDCSSCIRVCALGAATGLEAPIVFLLGAYQLYEAEQSVRLAEADRLALIRDNTRKLYMACTRAGQRLVLTYVGDVPDVLRELVADHRAIQPDEG